MSTEGDAPVPYGQEPQVSTSAGHRQDLLELEVVAANSHSSSPEVVGTTADSKRGDSGLVSALCRALEEEHVSYCHWKSNEALDHSVIGDNDLDLLVSRSDTRRFEEILKRLGFKDAQPPQWKQLPGIWHSYGLDRKSGEFVHIHAHYQLVIGDDMTKNYRLPIEEPYLASAVSGTPFRIPIPEFEFAVFLVRMVVKHCSWDALLCLQSSLSRSERRELTYLVSKVDPGHVWAIMDRHLPFLPRELWEACLRSLQPGSSIWFRIKTAGQLQRKLVSCSRRPRAADTYLRMWRRVRTVLHRQLLRRSPGLPRRLSAAGVLIAVVGGDGAGKSTVVEDLSSWLAKNLVTKTVHLGKPPRSLRSVVLRNLMKIAASMSRSPTSSSSALKTSLAASNGGSMTVRSYARLVWEVLTARDRYRQYRRARRWTTNGAIVVCDRYPLPEVKLMDGAVTRPVAERPSAKRLLRYLSALERSYYSRITYPDLLVVLKLDPDLAVLRKQDEEDEAFTRPRADEIWHMNWADTPAVVIDASRSKAEVLSDIKSVVWSRL
jgi:thymidylate kinase